MIKRLFVLILLIGYVTNAQKKYVVVPHKFSFSIRNNQYGLNNKVKSFFEEEGFVTFFDDELPVDIEKNKCLAYYVSVRKKRRSRKQSMWIDIMDCTDSLVAVSVEGKSKLLEVSRSSNESLDKALVSLRGELVVENRNIKTVHVSGVSNVDSGLYVLEYLDPKRILFVNSTMEDTIQCIKTSLEDVYLAKKDRKNGLVYKKNKHWFFEYVLKDVIVSEKIKTKRY